VRQDIAARFTLAVQVAILVMLVLVWLRLGELSGVRRSIVDACYGLRELYGLAHGTPAPGVAAPTYDVQPFECG
jgi:hypothetical protein